jgi:hypothetical protein
MADRSRRQGLETANPFLATRVTMLAAMIVQLLGPASAAAKAISIRTEVAVMPMGRTPVVGLKVTNAGDEAAHSVRATSRMGGREVRGTTRPSLGPGESWPEELKLPWDGKPSGQWPLTTTIDYADANGYSFQAIQVALVSIGEATPAQVVIPDLTADALSRSGRLRAHVKSLSPAAQRVEIRYLVPRGLEVEPPAQVLDLAPWSDVQVEAQILNRSALVGSRYPVFVTVEYDDPGGHHATVAHDVVEILANEDHRARYTFAAAALLVLCWLAFLGVRVLRGRRQSLPQGDGASRAVSGGHGTDVEDGAGQA